MASADALGLLDDMGDSDDDATVQLFLAQARAKETKCDQPGCTYEAPKPSKLKKHKADRHGIDVVWHVCGEEGCEYKAKRAGSLKRHKASMHDIGVV